MSRWLEKFRVTPSGYLTVTGPPGDNAALLPLPMRQDWSAADLTLDGILLLDGQSVILDANPRALESLRRPLSAIRGYSLWDVLPQGIPSEHEAAAELALGASQRYTFVSPEHFENSGVEYILRLGAAGYVVNLREAGPAQKYQRLLENSKHCNRLIFEANPNAMWVFDSASREIFAANQAAIQFYGCGREAFMMLQMDALFPKQEGAELLMSLSAAKEDQSEIRLCKQKKMDGQVLLVELAWSQVNWNGHQAVLVSLADNSLKKANAELQKTLVAQQAELKIVRHDLLAFTQAVSSDLQDSLHVAQGFAARLAEKYFPVLDEQGPHYVQGIQANISQLVQLPLRSGASELINLAPVCASLVASLRKREPERNVTLEMDDPLMLVDNKSLLDNAWKFTSKRAEAWIKVSMLPGKAVGELVLEVTDNNAGFDAATPAICSPPFSACIRRLTLPATGWGWRSPGRWRKSMAARCGRTVSARPVPAFSCRSPRRGRTCFDAKALPGYGPAGRQSSFALYSTLT